MSTGNSRSSYLRALREGASFGLNEGVRPEPSIDEARTELAEAISRVAQTVFKDKYGPLVGVLTAPTINEFLRGFEENLARAKSDMTIVTVELFDRIIPTRSKRNS